MGLPQFTINTNQTPPKEKRKERMPHGDFSDIAAIATLGFGVASIFAPSIWLSEIGPVKPLLDTASAETTLLIRFLGGIFVAVGLILSIVRWNSINGKAAGLGLIIAAINAVFISRSIDENKFVLRGWHVIAGFFVITAIALMFFANKDLTSADLLEKEAKAKAKKEAAKVKNGN